MVRGNELSARRLLAQSVVVVSKKYAFTLSLFSLSHFTISFPLCFNICIAWTIQRLRLSCCGFGFFHHDIEAHEHTPHHNMVTFISS